MIVFIALKNHINLSINQQGRYCHYATNSIETDRMIKALKSHDSQSIDIDIFRVRTRFFTQTTHVEARLLETIYIEPQNRKIVEKIIEWQR